MNAARAALQSAGYGNVAIGNCQRDDAAPAEGRVTATDPAANSSANKSTSIRLDIVAKACP